ncbi:MFS transporter [Amycolatopsis sp. CA-128772]|uniref:MFS transporter n=1 Tax=Amycolatopsis sp. CA-128772 TaxID=2073159 RepID=UPI000CD131AE|nr:MFS transporter [Amycolatopsis sp. CA-128772]
MSSLAALPRSPWLVVALGFGAIVFEGYDLIVYGSVVPAMLAHPGWGLSAAEAGAIGSYALLGMFLGAPASGWLTDRFGRRRLFIGLLVWFSVMMVLVALAPTPGLLGLFRFLAGLGFGGIPPTAIALVVEAAPAGRKLFYNSVMLSGFPVGGVVAAVASLTLLGPIGFRGLFALGVLPLVTLVPLAWWVLPESARFASAGAESGDGKVRALLRGRAAVATLLFAVANFCGFLLVFGLNTWLPQLMRGAGYDLGSALTFLLLLNIGSVVGGLVGAAISDRFGGRAVATALFVLAAAAMLLLTAPRSPMATSVLVFVAGAMTVGSQSVLWGYVATHYDTAARATALGVTSGIGRLGAAAGPAIGGLLVANGVGLAGNVLVFAGAALAGAVSSVLVPRRRTAAATAALAADPAS